jgi:DNA-binding response OmpR family regulator
VSSALRPVRFVAIVGHGPELAREDGVLAMLQRLGADVRALDFWDEPATLFRGDHEQARAIVVEAGARPDLGALVLRTLRREPRLEGVGAILAVSHDQVGRLEPGAGFDDFVLSPIVPAELYARLKAIEWKRSEFTNEERVKVGDLVVDRAAREVTLHGRVVGMTSREFDLLVYLSERRGRVVSRRELLQRVWGAGYDGGARTIDIHVRRLRAKLGHDFDLTTVRGTGYRMGVPGTAPKDDDR